MELKIFAREDAKNIRAFLFEPLFSIKSTSIIREKKKGDSSIKTWEGKLAWANDNVRYLVKSITERILELENVSHRPSGNNYEFFKGKDNAKYAFAAILLRKKDIKIRIRTEPTTFSDPRNWVDNKIYHWFFSEGQEKAFELTEKSDLDYAMSLIKQSYELIK